jgi:hypothetical protein
LNVPFSSPKAHSKSKLPGTPEEILKALGEWTPANQATGKVADVAHGALVVGDQVYFIRSSGLQGAKAGYASDLAPRGVTRLGIGYTSDNIGHIEGSVAAILRKLKSMGVDVSQAELYMNLPPCKGGGKGCLFGLEKMLPEGTRLDVWATRPNSKMPFHQPFTGKPDR